MITNTLIRPTGEIIDIDSYRRDALLLRDRYIVDMMRGTTVTTWCHIAGVILLLAAVMFASRSHVTPGVAMTAAPITVAFSHYSRFLRAV